MFDRRDELRSVPGDGQIVCTLKPDKVDGFLALGIPGYADEVMRLHNAEVERRIVEEGQNEVRMIYPPDRWKDGDQARVEVYTIPNWFTETRARLRVAWARWKYRRRSR